MPELSYLDDPWPEPDLDDDRFYDDSDDDVGEPDVEFFDRWADDWPVEDPNMTGPYEVQDLEVEDIIPGHRSDPGSWTDMEHLLNCHGEIAALVSFLSILPMIGLLIRNLRLRFSSPTPHEEHSA